MALLAVLLAVRLQKVYLFMKFTESQDMSYVCEPHKRFLIGSRCPLCCAEGDGKVGGKSIHKQHICKLYCHTFLWVLFCKRYVMQVVLEVGVYLYKITRKNVRSCKWAEKNTRTEKNNEFWTNCQVWASEQLFSCTAFLMHILLAYMTTHCLWTYRIFWIVLYFTTL